ncbi:uncharacterized protein [Anas acuta]|uniref:uncharacterized protein isoform X2 n=1 Tax=Anas acuta TaxID=28680 RepID=UPI0035C88480
MHSHTHTHRHPHLSVCTHPYTRAHPCTHYLSAAPLKKIPPTLTTAPPPSPPPNQSAQPRANHRPLPSPAPSFPPSNQRPAPFTPPHKAGSPRGRPQLWRLREQPEPLPFPWGLLPSLRIPARSSGGPAVTVPEPPGAVSAILQPKPASSTPRRTARGEQGGKGNNRAESAESTHVYIYFQGGHRWRGRSAGSRILSLICWKSSLGAGIPSLICRKSVGNHPWEQSRQHNGWARGRDADWQQEGELSSFGQQPGLRGFTQETRPQIVLAPLPAASFSWDSFLCLISPDWHLLSVSLSSLGAERLGSGGRGAFVPL